MAMAAECVFCISKTTKKDLQEFLLQTGCRIPRLVQITLGTVNRKVNCLSASGDLKRKYILYVSTIEARKNHDILYKAYHRLASQFPESKLPQLVFVGMNGWWVGDLLHQISTDPLVRDLIVIKGRVTDAELGELYKNCLFTVFPSNYEGYGLGVAESLSYGKTCLISNQGALNEFDEKYVLFADPWDVNQWCEGIKKLLDNDFRCQIEKTIQKTFVFTPWSDSGSVVLDVINQDARK